MSFSNQDNSGKGQIKSFVSETELEELKRRREEEWKKVKDASGKPIIGKIIIWLIIHAMTCS